MRRKCVEDVGITLLLFNRSDMEGLLDYDQQLLLRCKSAWGDLVGV